MAQRKRRRGHRHPGAAAGLTGVAHTAALPAQRRNPALLHPPRRLDLGSPPGVAAELHLRAADRAADAPGGGHADVRQGRRRARRPGRAGDPLGDPGDRGAVGDPAAVLRAGAVPGPHPDDPGGADAPRPVPLRVLRRQGRHRRPRGAAQPRRRPLLGELRRCCSTCNHRKADRLLAELGWALRSAPVPPKGQHWRLLSTVKELDPAWVRYLGEGAA